MVDVFDDNTLIQDNCSIWFGHSQPVDECAITYVNLVSDRNICKCIPEVVVQIQAKSRRSSSNHTAACIAVKPWRYHATCVSLFHALLLSIAGISCINTEDKNLESTSQLSDKRV